MYTIVIDPLPNSCSHRVVPWLQNLPELAGRVVVIPDDLLALPLITSASPPVLVLRCTADGLASSPLEALRKASRPPPVFVLHEDMGAVALGSWRAWAHLVRCPRDAHGLVDLLEGARGDGARAALLFDDSSELPQRHFGELIGESSPMLDVYRRLERIARSDATCLITGESGTGKELAARVVRGMSRRQDNPFVTVNCGAIPENLLESEFFGHKRGAFTGAVADHKGRFAQADSGTLFLDEIGDMDTALQVKLLRALQTGEIQAVGASRTLRTDVRVIAATNRDLEEDMRQGRFREDLYYRLAVVPVHMPPLRDRRQDIPLLVQSLGFDIGRRMASPVHGISRPALDALCRYEWPGNVRELASVIEHMLVMADGEVLQMTDLPPRIWTDEAAASSRINGRLELPEAGLDLRKEVEEFENHLMRQALKRTGWNKKQASRLLGINRTTLVEKLKRRGMSEAPTDDASGPSPVGQTGT